MNVSPVWAAMFCDLEERRDLNIMRQVDIDDQHDERPVDVRQRTRSGRLERLPRRRRRINAGGIER